MRRAAFVCSFLAIAACAAAQDDGKIPITTSSDEARRLFLAGRAANENLQTHEGHALFERAVAADPAFALGEYSIAATAPTARDQAEHLRKALALSVNVSPGERLMILAMQARTNADPARALLFAESLATLYPRDERARWILANAFSARQQYDSAIAQFEHAIAINHSYALAYNQLGYAFRGAGKLDSAESIFRQYIALIPGDPNPYDSYAELLMKMGRFDESIEQYRRALSKDPHFGGSFVGIAADQMYAGRYPEAVAEAHAYLDSARDDGERRTALLTLAMIYVDEGMTDSAVAVMHRRYDLAGAEGDTINISGDFYEIGDILLEAGRLDMALVHYRRARDLLAASSVPVDLKLDNDLAWHCTAGRLAIARHSIDAARGEAEACQSAAASRHNDARLRQAHELNGLVAIESRSFDAGLSELAQADQQSPAVILAMAKAYAGKGDMARSLQLSSEAAHMNILPTLPYVFTRRALAAASRSAMSGSAPGTPR